MYTELSGVSLLCKELRYDCHKMRYVNTTWIFLKSLSLYIPIQGTQLLKENSIKSLSCITMTIKRTVVYETMPDVRQGIQIIKKLCQ